MAPDRSFAAALEACENLRRAMIAVGISAACAAHNLQRMMVLLPDPVPSYDRPFILRMLHGRMVDFDYAWWMRGAE